MKKAVTARDILQHAKRLIALPDRWLKFTLAADKDGHEIDDENPKAVAFCALGAICRASYLLEDRNKKAYYDAFWKLGKAMGGNIVDYNNAPQRTHRQILAAFDRASKY